MGKNLVTMMKGYTTRFLLFAAALLCTATGLADYEFAPSFVSRGAAPGQFDNPVALRSTTQVQDGTLTVLFHDCKSDTINYNIPSLEFESIPAYRAGSARQVTPREALVVE